MNTPDFENAPEGATHYYQDKMGFIFYKFINGEINYLNDDDSWAIGSNTDEWYKKNLNPIPQPAKEDWFGKGELPPIGEKVIFKERKLMIPVEVIILAHVIAPNGQPCAVYCEENCNNSPVNGIAYDGCFSPLKSDREKCIEAAMKVSAVSSIHESIIEALYDAGMLRMREDK